MPADPVAVGKAFLAEVLSALPDGELRTQASALFDKAEAQTAIQKIGEGTLRQSDYSKAMATVQEKDAQADEYHGQLSKWAGDHETELKDLREYKAKHPEQGGNVPNNSNPNLPANPIQTPAQPTADAGAIIKQVRAEMDTREQDYAAFIAESTPLAVQHFRDFNEVLDMRKLMTHPNISKVGLKGVYEEVYAEPIRARREAEEKVKLDKVKAEAKAEARQELLAQGAIVFPPPSDAGGSPLDHLTQKAADGQYTAESAARFYNEQLAKQS